MTPKIVDKEEKKQQILEAAIRVFAKFGLPNTRMLHIAQAAGIGKGTIYEYFRSKEDLFIAAFNAFVKESNMRIEKRVRQIHDPEEKLKAYFRGWIEIADSDVMELADIMLDMWAEGIRSTEGKDKFNLKGMYENYREQIVQILDEGIRQKKFKPMDTTIVSSIIIGTLDGLFLQWIMDRDIFQIREAMETLERIIIEGLTED
jgi:AcrR family transcriptional regulator